MKNILYAIDNTSFDSLFDEQDIAKAEQFYARANTSIPESVDKAYVLSNCADAEVIITSWCSPALDSDIVEAAPHLKLLVHAAGSVKPVTTDALWNAGVRVVSCAAAIAYGVAEYCLGLMLTECKRVFWAANGVKTGKWQEDVQSYGGAFELYRQSVGIIGAGFVGTRLIELLKPFQCNILLFDPYCSETRASELGVRKTDSLDELFSECRIVSLNAPSTDETKSMLKGNHFAQLQDGALFINTARNAIIDQDEFVEEMKKERFIACLDVTDPTEPPPVDHPYRSLPNILLTPHIAGVVAENKKRIGEFACAEITAFAQNQPLKYIVEQKDLHKTA